MFWAKITVCGSGLYPRLAAYLKLISSRLKTAPAAQILPPSEFRLPTSFQGFRLSLNMWFEITTRCISEVPS